MDLAARSAATPGEVLAAPRLSRPMVAAVLVLALLAGLAAAALDGQLRQQQRLLVAEAEAQRTAHEVIVATLASPLMGALTQLGLGDAELRRHALARQPQPDAALQAMLRGTAAAFAAEAVFFSGADGVLRGVWDSAERRHVGMDVSERPWFAAAMAGHSTVHAGIVEDGALLLTLAAPVIDPASGQPQGVVAGRLDAGQFDLLLRAGPARALLVSPQGVAFSGGGVNGSRIAPRQQVPAPGLSLVDGRLHAVASAALDWHDETGPWRLVWMEPQGPRLAGGRALVLAGGTAALVLLLAGMGWRLHRGQWRQRRDTARLRQFAAQHEAMGEFRAGLSTLAGRLQRCEQMPELAAEFLAAARALVGAIQGAVYVASRETPPRLLLAGSAAAASTVPDRLALGEGLLGQCALDRRLLILDNPPPGPWQLRSGLGHSRPGALLLAPLVLQDELIGAVELALARAPDAAARACLDDLLALLGNSLEILRRSERADLLRPPVPQAATEEV